MLKRYRPLTRRLIDTGVSAGRRLSPGLRRALRRAVLSPAPNAAGVSPLRALQPHAVPPGPSAGAEVVTSFDAWAHRRDLARRAVAALSNAGVESVLLDSRLQPTVAVHRKDKKRALAAFATQDATRRWWAIGNGNKPVRLAEPDKVRSLGNSIQVFRKLVSPEGWHVADSETAAFVEFWSEAGEGRSRPDGGDYDSETLMAESKNPWAQSLTPAEWQQAQDREDRRLPLSAAPHLLDLIDPVDLVYTWVDDLDPAWQQRLTGADPQRAVLAADALDPARTRAGDHLRYSLRSVAMYANWVRHIWIVTDAQTPSWLVPNHPKVTVVDHREIFTDPSVLPTFNSQSIESQLHHIPGLAEHFLYLNDDFFFGSAVHPEDFFEANGIAKFMMSTVPVDRDADATLRNAAMLAARHNRALLEQTFGRTVTNRMQHVPYALTKTTLQAFEDQFPDEVAAVAAAQFRSRSDYSIPSDLAHYYGFARSEAIPGSVAFSYIDVGSPLLIEKLESLLVERNVQTFCLNDVGAYTEPVPEDLVNRFLAAYFPVASPFEMGE